MMHTVEALGLKIGERFGLFELCQIPLVLLMIAIAFRRPAIGGALFRRLEAAVSAVAAKPIASIGLVLAASLICRGSLIHLLGTSDPISPDELSTMLQAQTYITGHLSGHIRLTPDFDSIYILLNPTYSSMYPVLRSAPLVVGQIIGVGFAGGVWLSVMALCVLTYWTLLAFVPSRYALAAALLTVLRLGVFSWWVNSYFGPVLTAIGGLLLVGGYVRLIRQATVLHGGVVGLGVFLLMTTRPFEGMVFTAPFACGLLIHFLKSTRSTWFARGAAGLAAAVFIMAGLGLTLAHNQAVTGDAKVAPYTLYRASTAKAAPFMFQKAMTHPSSPYMQEKTYVDAEMLAFDRRNSIQGILGTEFSRFLTYMNFYVGFAFLIPFLIGAAALRRRPVILAAALLFSLALALETWPWSQYASPAFGLFMAAIALGFQKLRGWTHRGRPVGLGLSRLLPAGLAAGLLLPLCHLLTGFPNVAAPPLNVFGSSCCWLKPRSLHAAIDRTLATLPGRNIVIVDEGPRAPAFDLLVYNEADIDHANTIWINADPARNPATLRRFGDRRRWLLGWRADGLPCLRPLTGYRPVTPEPIGRGESGAACLGPLGRLSRSSSDTLQVRPPFPL